MAGPNTESNTRRHTPICPRCGYDQSGVITAWTDRCPLEGRCSECGLEFWWRQVLGEQALGPVWSVEHGPRLSARRLARAYMTAVWQRGLWKRFELVAEVRTERLTAFAAVSFLVNHLLLAVLLTAGAKATMLSQIGTLSTGTVLETWLLPYTQELEVPTGQQSTMGLPLWPFTIIVGLSYAVTALTMLVFTQSMSRIGVRPDHIYRGAVYMLPATVPVMVVGAGLLVGTAFIEELAWPGSLALYSAASVAVIFGWPLVQVLRWRSFVRHYLRLPHGNWIALAMGVILGLCLFLAFLVAFITTGG